MAVVVLTQHDSVVQSLILNCSRLQVIDTFFQERSFQVISTSIEDSLREFSADFLEYDTYSIQIEPQSQCNTVRKTPLKSPYFLCAHPAKLSYYSSEKKFCPHEI